MSKKEIKEEIFDDEEMTLEEMSFMLNDMLCALLFYAGVDKKRIEEAYNVYMDSVDDVFGDEEGVMGFEEIVKVVEHMKKKNPALFSNSK